MSLSATVKKKYRAIAHHLKPIIAIGDKGLNEQVLAELDRALEDHELIKCKLHSGDREERADILTALCEASGAEAVQSIGKVALLYRAAKKPNPKLSNILRHA